MSILKNPGYKAILSGKWASIKISGNKNKTNVCVKDLFALGQNENETLKEFYIDLVKNDNKPAYSLVRAILSTKNITGIFLDNKKEIMVFKDVFSTNKNQTLNVSFRSSELIDKKDEIINLSIRNFNDSREQFLDKMITNDDLIYNFNLNEIFLSYKYDIKNNSVVFNLTNYIHSDKEFLLNTIDLLLKKCNNKVTIKKEFPNTRFDEILNYQLDVDCNNFNCFTNVSIDTISEKININFVDISLFDEINNLVKNHNEKTNLSYKKRLK